MVSRFRQPFLWLPALALATSLACNAVLGANPTPLPPPSQAPTQAPPLATRTQPPEPTATFPEPAQSPPTQVVGTQVVLPEAGLTLDSALYSHPEGIFEFYPPVDWVFTQEDDGSVLMEAPDASGAINLQVTNTGYALDPQSFERFVSARDFNFFSVYDGYQEVSREMDSPQGIATVVKSLFFEGVPQTVISYYDQHDRAIYTLDFWADEDVFETYADGYDDFFEAVVVDSDQAAEQDYYLWVYDHYGPDELFVIEVPTSWAYEMNSGDFTIVDTFISPDEHAVIQNIAYDDGQAVSKTLAGSFALELLKTYYASDVRVTDDQVQTDGSERLTWNSPSGDFSGISFFESRGTTFLLFTVMYDNPFEETYVDILDYTIASYEVP